MTTTPTEFVSGRTEMAYVEAKHRIKNTRRVLHDLAGVHGGHPVIYFPSKDVFDQHPPSLASPLRDCWYTFPARTHTTVAHVYLQNVMCEGLGTSKYDRPYVLDAKASHDLAHADRSAWLLPEDAEGTATPLPVIETDDPRYVVRIVHCIPPHVPRTAAYGDVSLGDYLEEAASDSMDM